MPASPSLQSWIRKYFPESSAPEILRLVMEYGGKSWHREPDRVRRDLVILSRGSVDRLRVLLQTADQDYRDILVGEEVDPWLIQELKDPPSFS